MAGAGEDGVGATALLFAMTAVGSFEPTPVSATVVAAPGEDGVELVHHFVFENDFGIGGPIIVDTRACSGTEVEPLGSTQVREWPHVVELTPVVVAVG